VPGASTSTGLFLELDGAISEVDISSNALGRTNIDGPGPSQRSSRASEGLQGRRGGRPAPGASTSAEDFLELDGTIFDLNIPSNFRLNSNIYGSRQLQMTASVPETRQGRGGGRGRGRGGRGGRSQFFSPARTRNGAANRRHHESVLSSTASLCEAVQDDPCPFAGDHNEHTNILDMGLANLGSLAGAANSLEFIPSNMVKMVRRVYIKYMQSLQEDWYSLDRWSKFLLLPFVLFTQSADKKRRQVLRERCTLLLADDWTQFTLGTFMPRHTYRRVVVSEEGSDNNGMVLRDDEGNRGADSEEGADTQRTTEGANTQGADADTDTGGESKKGGRGGREGGSGNEGAGETARRETVRRVVVERVRKYVQQGNLSSAMRYLLSSDMPHTAPTQRVLEQLHAKHPQLLPEHIPPRYNCSATVQKHCFTSAQLIKVVMRCKKLIKHGLDHLRYEHLQSLIRNSKYPMMIMQQLYSETC
jgi:hypothetical protein